MSHVLLFLIIEYADDPMVKNRIPANGFLPFRMGKMGREIYSSDSGVVRSGYHVFCVGEIAPRRYKVEVSGWPFYDVDEGFMYFLLLTQYFVLISGSRSPVAKVKMVSCSLSRWRLLTLIIATLVLSFSGPFFVCFHSCLQVQVYHEGCSSPCGVCILLILVVYL